MNSRERIVTVSVLFGRFFRHRNRARGNNVSPPITAAGWNSVSDLKEAFALVQIRIPVQGWRQELRWDPAAFA